GGCRWAGDGSLVESLAAPLEVPDPRGSKPVMNALALPTQAPSGAVALVFTDIQGSTQLWERCTSGMRAALELHDRILRTLLVSTSGYEVKTQGDSFMVAFPTVADAARWCLDVQEVLLAAPWPEELLAQPEV